MTKKTWQEYTLVSVPAAGGILSLGWLFFNLSAHEGHPTEWRNLAKLGAGVLIAFGIAALLRYALRPLIEAPKLSLPASAPGSDSMRDRIAPIVLGVGSIAIAVLAVGVIVAFSQVAHRDPNSEIAKKFDTLLMGIFTAVLPVFATWVGTVIAFYFTNESFRQAAQSAREAAQGVIPTQRAADKMIPYEKIAKKVVDRAQARTLLIDQVIGMFNDNTTRVIIFDQTKQPIFIIRRKSPIMPPDWTVGSAATQGKTIDDYLKLNGGQNAKDAAQFGFVAEDVSLDTARVEMFKSNSVDLFVTATGQKTEEVKGWLPDDKLK